MDSASKTGQRFWRSSPTTVAVASTVPVPCFKNFAVILRPPCFPLQTMDAALLLHIADDAAGGLQHAADVNIDDESNEDEGFGPGSNEIARMQPAGVPELGPLAFEVNKAARAARRASSGSAASSARGSPTWSAIESATVTFNRFLPLVDGAVDGAGGGDLTGERKAVTLNDALPFSLHRFLALLLEGGSKHLVGRRNVPL